MCEMHLCPCAQVNEYPCQRSFKCVGLADDSFREAMVQSVEEVIGTKIHPESVNIRPSSKGKYISVQIGPVIIKTPEQVRARAHSPVSCMYFHLVPAQPQRLYI